MMVSSPKLTSYLRIAQISIVALTGVLSLAVLATSAHVLNTFQTQKADLNPWWLPLWPEHFDTTNTSVYVGTAATTTIFSIVFLVLLWVPRLSMAVRPKLSAVSTLGFAVIVFLLALSAVIFDGFLRARQSDTDTIGDWACMYRTSSVANDVTLADVPDNVSNASFSTLCSESMFDFIGMIIVLVLQVLVVGVAIGQWVSRSDLRQKTEPKVSTADIDLGSAKAFM